MPSDVPNLPFFFPEQEYCRMIGRFHANRRVLINGTITSESMDRAALELIRLEHEKVAPITLLIQSGGGNMVPGQQLEDTINMLQSPVDGIAMGCIASMAVDLFQMCRRRYMLPQAQLLVHYIRNQQRWICDDPEQLENDIKYFRERMIENREKRFKLYEKRTGLSRVELARIFRHGEVHQAYFSATQAVEMNLADEIMTDFKLFPAEQ